MWRIVLILSINTVFMGALTAQQPADPGPAPSPESGPSPSTGKSTDAGPAPGFGTSDHNSNANSGPEELSSDLSTDNDDIDMTVIPASKRPEQHDPQEELSIYVELNKFECENLVKNFDSISPKEQDLWRVTRDNCSLRMELED